MTSFAFPRLALAMALSVPFAAHADEADFDVPGPNGRSSISASVDFGSYSADNYQNNTFLGESRGNTRGLGAGGVFAINDRISLDAGVGRSITHSTYTMGNTKSRSTSAQNGGYIGISARPVGSPTAPGFGLVLGATASHSEGYDTFYSVSVMPQVRFSPTLVGSLTLGAVHADDYHGTALAAALSIKATPNFSVTPNVAWARGRSDGNPSLTSSSVGVMLGYHFTRNLSLEGGFDATVWKDRSYAGGYRVVDDAGVSSTVGLRWSF